MLEIDGLSVSYGGLSALRGVSLHCRRGEFVSIIGPNGAGKTTLFKAISGIVTPRLGAIRFNGVDLLGVAPSRRPHLGIAHVPEGRQVFPSLTVLENLEMGAFTDEGRRRWRENIDYIYTLFPVLAERRRQFAGTLSGGEQQMLAIGRGLAAAPAMIMLDEPSMGLSPATADIIFERIVDARKQRNLTVLLVEQRAVEALQTCDHGYVLESGTIALEGAHDQLLANDRVRRAYLGA
ncbi:MAG: ABC transporter ATP-binding protein [Rhodospirillales bacterium]|nr:ABC transporter ATP-binding protein [Rhodospirillales bacterium]